MTSIRSILTLILPIVLGLMMASPTQAKNFEGVLNINTASLQELILLPGIGQAKAQAIIDMRSSQPFQSIDDLKNVKGIGEKRLEAMRPFITTEGPNTLIPVARVETSPETLPALP